MDSIKPLSMEDSELLARSQLLSELANSKGYQEVLKPFLEGKIKTGFIDPRKFKTDEEYAFACKVAWGWAQAADDILKFIEEAKAQAEYLKQKERGEIVDKFSIGK